jgi:mono/diheme cytochrome c family protein
MTPWQTAALASLLALAGAASAEDPGREVFFERAQPPCALCHALESAGASGTIGPSLDELKPDKARVVEAVRAGVGVMPAFADKLTEQEIQAVAEFVAKAVSGR